MTRPTRQMRSAVILEGGALGYSPGDGVDEVLDPVDVASLGQGAAVQVAVSVTEASELLTGETVTSNTDTGTPPTNPSNVNDRDYETISERPSGVFAGSYAWAVDFGSAVEVTSMAVDHSIGIGDPDWQDPASAFPEWSDDDITYTPATFAYSTSTVPTGVFPTTTTRYIYTLDTPSTHRYWRIRKTVGGGFHVADGMAEWFIFGSTSSDVEWEPAPAANDEDDATYAESDATFPGNEWLQVDLGRAVAVYRAELLVGWETAGSKTLEFYGYEDALFTTPVLLDSITYEATGSFTPDDVVFTWTPTAAFQYFRCVKV